MGRHEKALRPYAGYVEATTSLDEAKAVAEDESEDADVRELAREEAAELTAREAAIRRELLIALAAEEGGNAASAIVEIRAGTGGDEAALFAGDLLDMYRHYCEGKGWKIEMLDASPSDLGGFRDVTFRVAGEGCFGRLRFEAGTHRVQRVPKTEAQGRIHTSAATVAILTEPEDVEINISQTDLDISYMRSQGPGGQSVNTTDSCVRIVHKPTGIAVKCMVEKSQRRNQELAMRILRAKLKEAEEERAQNERSENRRSQIGSGDRSGRVRTYNFPQNRVTDHRLVGDKNFPLERVIEGNLDPVIDRLIELKAGITPAPPEGDAA
jgi:peptide chain release factor 1